MGCSSWGREESDTTDQLHFHFSLSCTGEGNGNPLQYSCLENPRDGEAADYSPLVSSCPWNIPGKTTGVGCRLLLQGIFLTQGDHTHVTCVFCTNSQLVQSLNHVWLFATPWTAACQASLSITNSWSLLKLMSIKSVMPSYHLILRNENQPSHPLSSPSPPAFSLSHHPGSQFFSNESVLCIRWSKYWSFSFSISPFHQSFQCTGRYILYR